MANEVYDEDNKYRGIPLVTDETRDSLNPRQEIAYRELRRELAECVLNCGKNLAKADGYAHSVAKNRMNKLTYSTSSSGTRKAVTSRT